MTPFAIHDLDGELDPASWVALVPPIDCDSLLISNQNGGAALTLKNAADAHTLSIPAGSAQLLTPPPPRVNTRNAAGVQYRYPRNTPVGYLKPASGTGSGMYLLWA